MGLRFSETQGLGRVLVGLQGQCSWVLGWPREPEAILMGHEVPEQDNRNMVLGLTEHFGEFWGTLRWEIRGTTGRWLFFFRFYLFRERGREGEREGQKHQCVVASHVPPTGDLAKTQACALTGNQTGNPLVCRLALKAVSHTSQGPG